MTRSRAHARVFGGLAVAVVLLGAWSQRKPVVRDPRFHIEGRAAASGLDDLWNRSRLVIAGTIQSSRPLEMRITRAKDGPVGTFTVYGVKVDEVLRSTLQGPQPGSIELRRRGGVSDKGDHILELIDPQYPPFEIGQSFVFFLGLPPDGKYFGEITGGPDSVFEISHGAVRAKSPSPWAQAIDHLAYPEFKARLEELRGRR